MHEKYQVGTLQEIEIQLQSIPSFRRRWTMVSSSFKTIILLTFLFLVAGTEKSKGSREKSRFKACFVYFTQKFLQSSLQKFLGKEDEKSLYLRLKYGTSDFIPSHRTIVGQNENKQTLWNFESVETCYFHLILHVSREFLYF